MTERATTGSRGRPGGLAGPAAERRVGRRVDAHRDHRAGRQRAARDRQDRGGLPHRLGGHGRGGRALVGRHRQRGVPADRREARGEAARRRPPARLRPGVVRLVAGGGLRPLLRRRRRLDLARRSASCSARPARSATRSTTSCSAIAFVLEGISFIQASRQVHGAAKRWGLHPLHFVSHTSNPTLRAVFFEDFSALLGILLAAAGIVLHQLTGIAAFDAIGSILIGVLLAFVAVFLMRRNMQYLLGEGLSPEMRDRVLTQPAGHPRGRPDHLPARGVRRAEQALRRGGGRPDRGRRRARPRRAAALPRGRDRARRR